MYQSAFTKVYCRNKQAQTFGVWQPYSCAHGLHISSASAPGLFFPFRHNKGAAPSVTHLAAEGRHGCTPQVSAGGDLGPACSQGSAKASASARPAATQDSLKSQLPRAGMQELQSLTFLLFAHFQKTFSNLGLELEQDKAWWCSEADRCWFLCLRILFT